jgi:hypothetical protein
LHGEVMGWWATMPLEKAVSLIEQEEVYSFELE